MNPRAIHWGRQQPMELHECRSRCHASISELRVASGVRDRRHPQEPLGYGFEVGTMVAGMSEDGKRV